MRALALFLTLMPLLVAAAGGDEGAPLDDVAPHHLSIPGEDDGSRRALLLGFGVEPTQIRMSRTVEWNPQGHIEEVKQSCTLYLKVHRGPNVRIMSLESLKLTNLTNGVEAPLVKPGHVSRDGPIYLSPDGNDFYSTSLTLPDVPLEVKRFGTLAGEVHCRIAVGEPKRFEAGRVDQLLGKPLKLPDLEGEPEVVLEYDTSRKRYHLRGMGVRSVRDVYFRDDKGSVIPIRRVYRYLSSADPYMRLYTDGEVAGTLEMTLDVNVESLRFPFILRQLPLTPPDQPPPPRGVG